MHILLLTIWHEKNFGAELQTYATIKTLTERGHKIEAIDFRLHNTYVSSLKSRVLNAIERSMPAHKSFEQFWKKYIPSTRQYVDLKDITENLPSADCYLVGSDQVWNPQITKDKALAFFLPFAPDCSKCISYASSFGTSKWHSSIALEEQIKELLAKFDHISCREESGAKILLSQFGIQASVVLDPTILRNDYNELIGKIKERNTLAFYELFESKEFEAAAEFIASKLSLQCLNINKMHRIIGGKFLYSRTSITDWIKGIAESKFVVTHSFHGVALSLLYHKQFIVIYNSPNKRYSRITDLLEKLGLMDRFYLSIEDARKSRIWEQTIDFSLVDTKLAKLRADSFNFLRSSGL